MAAACNELSHPSSSEVNKIMLNPKSYPKFSTVHMEPTIINMSHPQTLPSKEGKDLVIASSAFLFSCKPVRLQLYDFHVIAIASGCSNVAQGQLSWFSASQSEYSSTINFRIPLCSNMLQARD